MKLRNLYLDFIAQYCYNIISKSKMKTYTVEVLESGDRIWYLNDELHREDGPAIECANGTRKWFLNGKLHREYGPAVEYANGGARWYLNDEELTEEEFLAKTTNTITIDGVTYKLVKVWNE